ncbi:hypothetical protein D3C71_1563280 [compost metagenome]
MAGVEVRGRQLALELGVPQVVPAIELDVLGRQVGAVADGVHVRPTAHVIRADLGAVHQVGVVGQLGRVQLFEQAAVHIQPADVRSGEGDVAFRGLGQLGLVEPVDRAARDVLDRHARLAREFLADVLVDQVAEAAAPGADHQRVLGPGDVAKQRAGKQAGYRKFANH